MSLRIHFREEENHFLTDSQKADFENQMTDLVGGTPEELTGCCCLKVTAKGYRVHLILRWDGEVFEGSVSTNNLKSLYLALWNQFQPHLNRLRQGKVMSSSVPSRSPLKRSICRKEVCPVFEASRDWPGRPRSQA